MSAWFLYQRFREQLEAEFAFWRACELDSLREHFTRWRRAT